MATAAAYVCRNLVFAAGTALHTNLYVTAPAGHGLSLVEIGISFDGVTASAVPVLVEICTQTGTAGTGAASPPAAAQVRGRVTTGQAPTVAHNFTAEPGTPLVVRQWYVSPNGGTFIYPVPLGREIECDASGGTIKGISIRTTPAAAVNTVCYMEVEAIG